MRFYSGKQLFSLVVVTFIATFVLSMVFWNIQKGKKEPVILSYKDAPLNEIEEYQLPESASTLQPVNTLSDRFTEDEKNNIAIYNQLNSAVVNITTEVIAYNWFLEPIPQAGGSGSGSIIDSKGIILTNTHVVEKAYKVYVNLSDGSQFEGKVIGKDLENDLAVIQINPKGKTLNTIPFGSSAKLQIGQKVLAIGNPFGYDRTLTTGIISGLARPMRTSRNLVIQNMIQTDASINPGNSGGPLINSKGEMVGINTMIFSPSGGSVGIGFAVPVDTARRVIPDLVRYGEVKRGWLDITPVQLNASIVRYANLPVSKGILVSKVAKGGFAAQAGIRGGSEGVRYGNSIIYLGGDIIVEVDGQKIVGYTDLFSALEDNKPNDLVSVVVNRNGKEIEFAVRLVQRKSDFFKDS